MVRSLNYKCGKKETLNNNFHNILSGGKPQCWIGRAARWQAGELSFLSKINTDVWCVKAQGLSTNKRSCETLETQIDGGISGEHFARSIFGQIILMIQSFVIQVPDTSLHPGSVSFFGILKVNHRRTQHQFEDLYHNTRNICLSNVSCWSLKIAS